MNENDKLIAGAIIAILLLAIVFSAVSNDSDDEPEVTGSKVLTATQEYLKAPKVVMTAPDLYDELNDGDSTDDPFILDIRSGDDFTDSHIEGAVNLPYREVFETDNLALLPTDKQIVVVCYSGHTASQITALLNTDGYDAIALKWGYAAWSPMGSGSAFDPATGTNHYEVSDVALTPVEVTGKPTAPKGEVAPAADASLAAGKAPAMSATALHTNLEDGDTGNDPFMLDIRSLADYGTAHVQGSINLPFTTVFTDDNRVYLPVDRQIVVICYTGHTASQITALLNLNGYDATALKWGFVSWNWTYGGAKAFDPWKNALGAVPIYQDSTAYLEAPRVVTTASGLETLLNDGNDANDPFILDIRALDDYLRGHIPGAVNIPYRNVFTPENLSLLPEDDQIVVVCYTGHTASQTTALLNVAGYDAIALKFGFESWSDGGHAFTATADYELVTGSEPGTFPDSRCGDVFGCTDPAANNYNPDATRDDGSSPYDAEPFYGCTDPTANNYNPEATSDDGSCTYDEPEPEPEPVEGEHTNKLAAAAEDYLDSNKAPATSAASLRTLLTDTNDTNDTNDPYVLDIRASDTYNVSHIPTAHNLPWPDVLTPGLATLPLDRQIVVVCYTGHTASQTAALLNLNGYDAIALKWGFEGWSEGGKAFTPASRLNGALQRSPVILANDYLGAGKAPAMSAAALHGLLYDGDEGNDPFILDIRSAGNFAASHIKDAVNVAFGQVLAPETLAFLPDDRQIVVVCYTGHTASQATALLNLAGYDAIALKWGFEGWSEGGKAFDPANDAHDYSLAIGPGYLPAAGQAPEVWIDSVPEAATDYLTAPKVVITAETLLGILNDGFTSTNPFILDIRGATDYEAGHINGAVNIPFREVFTAENIATIPAQKQIVVVCYTGHTASQTTALLNLAGFEAIALKWGFESWSDGGHAFTGPGDYELIYAGHNLQEVADDYLGSPKVVITASALNTTLTDGDAGNDPFILDIRNPSDFNLTHIEDSVNIPFTQVFDNLDLLPDDNSIVVVCYTGHTASQTTALLNVAGYDAIALKFGFESWAPGGKAFNASRDRLNGALETTVNTASQVDANPLYVMDVTEAAGDYIRAPQVIIKATTLNNTLNDGDTGNDPFILDIRGSGDYTAGHIPGAVNIGFTSVFTEANFALLPDDRQIVVVCYTGHTASQTTALLNLNGFDALALKWGFESWGDGGKAFTGPGNHPTVGGHNLREAADGYLAAPKVVVTASSLNATLFDGDEGNDPFILDIRSYEAWLVGHVPGAVNVPFKEVFEPENLDLLPDDNQIVVVCYTGHTASQTTALLNVVGYDAIALKFGFESWSPGGKAFNATNDRIDGELETTLNTADPVGNEPLLAASITEAANNYLAAPGVVIKATVLNDTLNDGDSDNDPFILDIRGGADYTAGHIPGAVNIGFTKVFNATNFDLLPDDNQIVVVCYTGHTASQTTALLNLNGFDALALKWGFESWGDGGKAFTGSGNYEIEGGYDLRAMSDDYLALGKPAAMSASALYANLQDGNDTNDPFLLDIRSGSSYLAGRIGNSVNVPFKEVFEPDNLALLPDDNQIVVVCYTGHTASQTTALLNLAGYDAVPLKWGFEGWSEGGKAFDPASRLNGTLETTVNPAPDLSTPNLYVSSVTEAADDYLAAPKVVITATNLNATLNDGNASNDPFILDIRSGTSYLAGHIPGAVNIGFRNVFTPENFSRLPDDRQIVVVCYTGHTASQTTALLNLNGLDALALKFGFESWSEGGKAFTGAAGYPLENDLRMAADDYLALGKPAAMSAAALNATLGDGNSTNDPFILDIRATSAWLDGHIEGSMNVPFKEVFEPDNLALLPDDNQIVVVCYTGHTASQTTALLGAAGYDATALKWGFEGWSEGGKAFNASNHRLNGTLETAPNLPEDEATVAQWDVIEEAADEYLAAPKVVITASALNTTLNDGDEGNDPFILDIRGAADYLNGHVPGAINIGFRSVFTQENFTLLPDDRQIVVVCYTGHTASQITALLNLNGLDALALKWGFESWSDGGKAFGGSGNYEVVPGYDLRVAADDYLALGKPAAVSAASLNGTLNDGDEGNDPFILDIRGTTDFDNAHINGSVNIPFTTVFQEPNLAQLPDDQQIVVVCYTGHTASQTTALLSVAGFDAIALKWGFEGWAEGGKAFNASNDRLNGTLETQTNESPVTEGPSGRLVEDINATADDYLAAPKVVIKATNLNATLTDGDEGNDPFILDIRGLADYEAGHIQGAVNIGFRSVFTTENFSLLPDDRQIVVVCYSGHTASQITALLNLNGLDAIALKWGFESWSDGGHGFTGSGDYETEST